MLMCHLTKGDCVLGCVSHGGCFLACNESLLLLQDVRTDKRHLQCGLLKTVGPEMSIKALRPLLCIHSVEFDDDDGLIILRRKLRNHVSRLEKDKQRDVERDLSYHRREATKDEARRAWPRRISEDI
jgi:hypothetical protein